MAAPVCSAGQGEVDRGAGLFAGARMLCLLLVALNTSKPFNSTVAADETLILRQPIRAPPDQA